MVLTLGFRNLRVSRMPMIAYADPPAMAQKQSNSNFGRIAFVHSGLGLREYPDIWKCRA
jgi:hypothetical protein